MIKDLSSQAFYSNLLDLSQINSYDIFCSYLGGVAQLARAFEWHSKGQGFNSPYLHCKSRC